MGKQTVLTVWPVRSKTTSFSLLYSSQLKPEVVVAVRRGATKDRDSNTKRQGRAEQRERKGWWWCGCLSWQPFPPSSPPLLFLWFLLSSIVIVLFLDDPLYASLSAPSLILLQGFKHLFALPLFPLSTISASTAALVSIPLRSAPFNPTRLTVFCCGVCFIFPFQFDSLEFPLFN